MNQADIIAQLQQKGVALTPEEQDFLNSQTSPTVSQALPDRTQTTPHYPLSLSNQNITFNPMQYLPFLKLRANQEDNSRPNVLYISDEVGVGKTYETGILLTELFHLGQLDLNKSKILLVCPNLLTQKWQKVLWENFSLPSHLVTRPHSVHGISIVPFHHCHTFKDLPLDFALDMLLVDEAHKANDAYFDPLFALRNKVTDTGFTLLLSATPLAGQQKDASKQTGLLFGTGSVPSDFHFTQPNPYLCRTLKQELRPSSPTWQIHTLVYETPLFQAFLEDLAPQLFQHQRTLGKFVALSMLSSSPRAGQQYFAHLQNLDPRVLRKMFLSQLESEEYEDDMEDMYQDEERELTSEEEEALTEQVSHLLQEVALFLERSRDLLSLPDQKLALLQKIVEDRKNRGSKVLIFAKYTETALYLEKHLQNALLINGSLTTQEKLSRYQTFRDDTSGNYGALLITNVAAEGMDMDFCDTLVNYDLDYNPVMLAQRMGRLDRFVKRHETLHLYNFAIQGFDPDFSSSYDLASLENASPDSMYQVLQRKLHRIHQETGIFYPIISPTPLMVPEPESTEEDKTTAEPSQVTLTNLLSRTYLQETPCTIPSLQNWAEEGVNAWHSLLSSSLQDRGIQFSSHGDYFTFTLHKSSIQFLSPFFHGGSPTSHLLHHNRKDRTT